MAEYQGHPSWNAWNVALYINNEEPNYRLAVQAVKDAKRALPKGKPALVADEAARRFERRSGLLDQRTPDGGIFNHKCIVYVMLDMLSEVTLP